jgi:inner membrane protein
LENIAHTFLGAALGQAGLKKISGLGMATLVIAANLPDIDLLWSYFSDTSFLLYHRGFTHSLLGIIPQMLILSVIMYFWGKRRIAKNPEAEDLNFRGLLFLSFIGLISHLGLDFLNDYGTRPYLPFSQNVYLSSTVFIVDAWFWLILGGYTFLTIRLNRVLLILFAIFAVLSSLLILIFPEIPVLSRLIYIGGVILLIYTRRKYGQIENRRLSIAVFSLFLFYNLMAAGLKHMADDHLVKSNLTIIPDVIGRHNLSPVPLNPFQWNFIGANSSFIYLGTISSLKQEGKLRESLPTNFTDPYVKKALKTDKGKAMQYFTNYLYAYTIKDREWVYVYLRDARYIGAGENGFATRVVTLTPGPSLRERGEEESER